MSFKEYRDFVREGETVILYLGFDSMMALDMKSGKVHQTKYGAVKHDDIIGKRYGSKVNCSRGYIHILHPTPELWTLNLPHRTQILYATDISMILYQLDLRPGSVVIESGTGSGSLAHSIIRTIAPTGHLHTFDFHEQRVVKAREEFEQHEVSDLVTVTHRDVCGAGFGLEAVADAVFLDLPSPWTTVASVKVALKPRGGRVCSFSPCIEQVQRTCSELTGHGFKDLLTVECLLRTFKISDVTMPLPDMGERRAPADQARGKKAGDTGDETEKFTSGVPPQTMAGHTGYLTFASLYR